MKTICLFFLLVVQSAAQDDGRSLAISGVYSMGIVKLRWGTSSTVVWNLLRNNGITLQRQSADDSIAITLNNNSPLRVWDEGTWKQRLNATPIAAQIVTLLRTDTDDYEELSDFAQADLDQNKLTSLLLIAEFNFAAAEGLAMAYRDTEVKPKNLYRYEVILLDPVKGDTLRAQCIISTEEEIELRPVTGLTANPGDHTIDLTWERNRVHSGYFVERRQQGTTKWTRLHKHPKLYTEKYSKPYLYSDTVTNGISYEYRVIGIDAFERNSADGLTAVAKARDLTPPEPPYGMQWKKKGDGVDITWSNLDGEKDLAGYILLRSIHPDENYAPVHKEILKSKINSFHDPLPNAGTYFYRMTSVDTSGNISPMSARIMAVIDDTLGPPPPTGLKAIADTNGVITIKWKRRMENDVSGYRVFRLIQGGNEPEYLPLHGSVISDTMFTDTLMADVRDRFVYRVRTVDFAGNYSEPSESIGISFPDRTPPIQPIVQNYSVNEKRVELQYISASTDAVVYEIRRKQEDQTKAVVLYRGSQTSWTDTTAQHKTGYIYEVVALDETGNKSVPSQALYVKPYWSQKLENPQPPTVKYNSSTRKVEIRWTYPESQYKAIVFKKNEHQVFLQLSPLLSESEYLYIETQKGRHDYAVRFYVSDVGDSEMSRETSVEIP